MSKSSSAHDYEDHIDSVSASIATMQQRLRDVEKLISHWKQTGNKKAIMRLIRKLACEERGLLRRFIRYLRRYDHEKTHELAHDIRNGLTGLTVYLGMIEKDLEGQKSKLIRSGMDKSVHYLEGLMQESKHGNPELEILDLSYLIRRAVKICGIRKVEPDLFLSRTLIRGNRVALIRVLVNLLENAYDALPDHNGTIVIRSLCKGDRCIVVVSDNGYGIKPDNLAKVFQKHFTTKVQGRGIGLDITKKIIEQHGGTIKVHSIPQEGADFIITLPKA
jgi:signal transduction histidine kinase